MAKYTLLVKKRELQYVISGSDKNFITTCVDKLFRELKNNSQVIDSVPTANLSFETDKVEKVPEKGPETKETITNQQNIADEEPAQTFETFEQSDGVLFEPVDELSQNEDFVPVEGVDEKAQTLNDVPQNSSCDTFNFEDILEDKINNPVYEEDNSASSVFDYEAILRMKQPESLVDYLIITAYYLLENENQDTFQLKQLNARLFNSMKMVVDRKTMQKAIAEGLLVVVDELDDGVVEYSLTSKGREFYINGCA